ncbi:MAG: DUF1080 domain-containing protein [Acidobacteria bacterium]|nr:DUF1080 domain-containing protein [Acidobacteriota bacterium]MBI3422655.1 DUF1080 domain-containing protein [Acidobacteriota bacterium]
MKKILLLSTIYALSALAVFAQTKNAADSANQLTAAEKKAGWRLLFDGKTFTGWRGFHKQNVPEGWIIEDNCISRIQAHGELGQAGGDLITADQFENFEFTLEWKISKGGNSGIKYLVSETLPPTGRSAVSFEMQVLDDDNHPDAKAGINGNRKASALYDIMPPNDKKKLKPVGEFNQIRLVVKGNHIEHWLNGQKVLEYERGSAALKALIAQSKFKDQPLFGTFAKGHLLLQEHGDKVWYRNIKIREIK